MRRGEINLAELMGLMAIVEGTVVGALGAGGRGAGWPVVAIFAACGFGVGFVAVKVMGRVAYACLARADASNWSGVGYILVSLAMPFLACLAAYAIPAVALVLGGA